jgi:hypothetical protein
LLDFSRNKRTHSIYSLNPPGIGYNHLAFIELKVVIKTVCGWDAAVEPTGMY